MWSIWTSCNRLIFFKGGFLSPNLAFSLPFSRQPYRSKLSRGSESHDFGDCSLYLYILFPPHVVLGVYIFPFGLLLLLALLNSTLKLHSFLQPLLQVLEVCYSCSILIRLAKFIFASSTAHTEFLAIRETFLHVAASPWASSHLVLFEKDCVNVVNWINSSTSCSSAFQTLAFRHFRFVFYSHSFISSRK